MFSYMHYYHCCSWRTFYRRMYNTQTVFKMIAQHNNAGPGPSWYLDRISVFNRAAMKYSRCDFRRWISWGNLSRKVLCRFVPPNLAWRHSATMTSQCIRCPSIGARNIGTRLRVIRLTFSLYLRYTDTSFVALNILTKMQQMVILFQDYLVNQ